MGSKLSLTRCDFKIQTDGACEALFPRACEPGTAVVTSTRGELGERGAKDMESSSQLDLARSLEELLFARHATIKNRIDIERVVSALRDAIRQGVARQISAGEPTPANRTL